MTLREQAREIAHSNYPRCQANMNLLPVPPSHNWGCDDCLEAVVSGMLLAFRLAQEVYGGECAVDALIAELEVEK